MPTIKPRPRYVGSAETQLLGSTVSDEQRLANALDVVNNLERWAAAALPERPEVLTYDDGQIYDGCRKTDLHLKLTAEAKSQLQYFSAWRGAVWRAESERAGSLQLLAACVGLLEAAEHWPEAARLRDFVWREYGAKVPDQVPENYGKRKRWAERFAQDRKLLPLHLRLQTKPPPGKETAGNPPQGRDAESDPNQPPF